MRITYSESVDAAYIYRADSIGVGGVGFTYACDPTQVPGMINLDFSDAGLLLGVEVLDASKLLPRSLLREADLL